MFMAPQEFRVLERRVTVSGFAPDGNVPGTALTGTGKGVGKAVEARDHASGAVGKEYK